MDVAETTDVAVATDVAEAASERERLMVETNHSLLSWTTVRRECFALSERIGSLIGHVTHLTAPLCCYNVSICLCLRHETALLVRMNTTSLPELLSDLCGANGAAGLKGGVSPRRKQWANNAEDIGTFTRGYNNY